MKTNHYGGEVVNAMLTGKSSKRKVIIDRTINRHRWLSREY